MTIGLGKTVRDWNMCARGCPCFKCSITCKCCGHNRLVSGNLCLWCKKDSFKDTLFNLLPGFCAHFNPELRFCRDCLHVIATPNDIREWIASVWSCDNDDIDDIDDIDERIALEYDKEYQSIYECLCECVCLTRNKDYEEWVRNTLSLSDVHAIVFDRTVKQHKRVEEELADE